MDEDYAETLNVGDRFEWHDITYRVIGTHDTPHMKGEWINVVTAERPHKPFPFPKKQMLAIRRADGGSEY